MKITLHYIAEKIDGWIDDQTDPRTVEELIKAMAEQSGCDARVIRLKAYRLARAEYFGV